MSGACAPGSKLQDPSSQSTITWNIADQPGGGGKRAVGVGNGQLNGLSSEVKCALLFLIQWLELVRKLQEGKEGEEEL